MIKAMLLVDIDNEKAIRLYEKVGFEKVKGNNITAHLEIKQPQVLYIRTNFKKMANLKDNIKMWFVC